MLVPCKSPDRLRRKDEEEMACIMLNKLVEETVHQVLFQPVGVGHRTDRPVVTTTGTATTKKMTKTGTKSCETLSLDLFGLFKLLPKWTLDRLKEEKKMFKQHLHKSAQQEKNEQTQDPESDFDTESDLSRLVDLTKYAILKLFLSEKLLDQKPHKVSTESTSTKDNQRVIQAQLILFEQFFHQVNGRPIQDPKDWLPITKTLKKFQDSIVN